MQPCSEHKGRLRASLAQTVRVYYPLISKSPPVCLSVLCVFCAGAHLLRELGRDAGQQATSNCAPSTWSAEWAEVGRAVGREPKQKNRIPRLFFDAIKFCACPAGGEAHDSGVGPARGVATHRWRAPTQGLKWKQNSARVRYATK